MALISDIDTAMAVIANEAVDCYCGEEQQQTVQPEHPVSCTGGVFYGLPGEQWPSTTDGEPLVPWLQVICKDLINPYGAFYHRQAVTFFIRNEFDDFEATSATDTADFVVREYALDQTLVPLIRPPELQNHPFHQVTWKQQPDYPALSKYTRLFARQVYRDLCDREPFEYENHFGIKIGGWPTPVQGNQDYPGSCDLQIDMTENYSYGDSGIGYLKRTGTGWYVIFESC